MNVEGKFYFSRDLLLQEFKYLKEMLGEDCRDHPEWLSAPEATHIDFQVSEDYTGIEHDGSEKTHHIMENLALIENRMQQIDPEFYLHGEMTISDPDYPREYYKVSKHKGDDEFHWDTGSIGGHWIECPNCEEEFLYED